MAKEEQSIHPGQLPYLMANLRNAIANVCRKSGVHPAIISIVLREEASQFDAQAQGMLDNFLKQVEEEDNQDKAKGKGGGNNKPD